jgi:hypothetical protein
LDGAFNIDTANGAQQGSDGLQNYSNGNPACVGNEGDPTVWKEMHWQLNGPGIVMAQQYMVSIRIYGVLECKTYNGGNGPGKTVMASSPPATSINMIINGANDNGDRYNTYALTVSATSTNALRGIGLNQGTAPPLAQIWHFNQCPQCVAETHYTWKQDGTLNIPVKGGEWINYVEYDSNCRMICNCGTAMASANCGNKHTLIPTGVNPPAPPILATVGANAQPPQNASQAAGQWWLFDVTNIQ